jgi:hypothetical protein
VELFSFHPAVDRSRTDLRKSGGFVYGDHFDALVAAGAPVHRTLAAADDQQAFGLDGDPRALPGGHQAFRSKGFQNALRLPNVLSIYRDNAATAGRQPGIALSIDPTERLALELAGIKRSDIPTRTAFLLTWLRTVLQERI